MLNGMLDVNKKYDKDSSKRDNKDGEYLIANTRGKSKATINKQLEVFRSSTSSHNGSCVPLSVQTRSHLVYNE